MSTSSPNKAPSYAAWVLIPAVVMSLGWGLRGYIGGGPFGAMIPGALVSMMLCQYLRCSLPAAAVVVAFGTIGIGFGGNMTYGQTLGLIRQPDTFLLGLAGTTIKGAAWGLLGGAVLGLGFIARHLTFRTLVVVLALMLLGIVIGIHFVNVPKLIYFSDRINKPRDESWAGLLLGACFLLTWLQLSLPKLSWVPWKFAAWGAIGGGIGFGVGSLFMTLQAHLSSDWNWLPCWKFMEFFFGFVFGAALGRCACCEQQRLTALGKDDADAGLISNPGPPAASWVVVPVSIVVLAVFYTWDYYVYQMLPQLGGLARSDLKWTSADVLTDYTGLGCVLLLMSRRWQAIAWQVAVSVTITATAIDWQRDLLPRGHIDWSFEYRLLFVLVVAALSIGVVQMWQRQRLPQLMTLFLFATCVLMGIGYMMGVAHADIWFGNPDLEAEVGGRFPYLLQQYRSELIVHAVFTTLCVISVGAANKERRRESIGLAGG